MEPNIDSRLSAIEQKLEQNHELLVRIRRVQRNGQLFKIFYWALIVLAAFGSFYFIQPYLEGLLQTYTGIQTSGAQMQTSMSDIGSLSDIIKQLKGEQ